MSQSVGDGATAASRRPRVLVVGQGSPTAGGIPTFVAALVGDDRLGARADIDYLNTTPRSEKKPGAFSLSNLTLLFAHARSIVVRGRSADVVHLNLAPAPLLPLVRAIVLISAAKLARSRVILHAHTGRMHLAAKSRLYRLALRLALKLTDEMVVVSELTERVVIALRGRVTRMSNGIDASDIPTGPKEQSPPTLTFVGTVCERKGLIDLRDALKRLKGDSSLPVRVLIIGDAKQEGPGVFEHVKQSYSDAGLPEVSFLGAVDRAEVHHLLGRSSIFCLPSHWEGFPLSLLEAMAAETAIVATDVGDVPAMLDHGDAGLVVPVKSPSELYRALEGLVSNPQERARLGAAARARVEASYTQEAVLDRLADLYERLAASSS